MTDPKDPKTDVTKTLIGESFYEVLPVSGKSQRGLSPGGAEPGDLGASRDDEQTPSHAYGRKNKKLTEGGGTDQPVEGSTGHEAFDNARAKLQQKK